MARARRLSKARESLTPVRPELSRREAKKEDKRARIVEAAWSLFSDHGVDATTTADIARRAGIAKGTLFLYATDKDDLVFLLMHDRLAEVADSAFAAVPRKAPLVEQLLHVFGALYSLYEVSGEIGRRFVTVLPGAQGDNATKVNALTFAFLHRVAALIIEAQARREVRPDAEPMIAAQAVFALYFSGLLSWLQGFLTLEGAKEVLRHSLDLLVRGLHAER